MYGEEAHKLVYKALVYAMGELDDPDIINCIQEGTLAADLHAFYNQVDLKEGWLKPEYATPLSEQDEINQIKNIEAAKDVVRLWLWVFEEETKRKTGLNIVNAMEIAVMYEESRDEKGECPFLTELAAESQHEQWRKFVGTYQKE